jgi:hypothetical protein
MFVNLEGDVTRTTLEFEQYPRDVVLDGRGVDVEVTQESSNDDEEGYIIAVMDRKDSDSDSTMQGLEIQRWDVDPSESGRRKEWINVPGVKSQVGIRKTLGAAEINFNEEVSKLQLRRLRLSEMHSTGGTPASIDSSDSRTKTSLERVSKEMELFESHGSLDEDPLPRGWEEARNKEEEQFARRFCRTNSRIVVWSQARLWWLVRTPLAMRLDAQLAEIRHDQRKVAEVVRSIQGQEARTESDFISLGYVRQKAGLLLFANMVKATAVNMEMSDEDQLVTEEALKEGALDPRVVLSIIPGLRDEVIEGRKGIWIHGGLKDIVESFIEPQDSSSRSAEHVEDISDSLLMLLKRYLVSWRRKKGFGSVTDEQEISRTVDAALLCVLLQLDHKCPRGPATAGSVRAELNDFVDHGVDCFSRAISILERNHRLYILSRLYQSRKMSRDVLATWKRLSEGERDDGGEFVDADREFRKYLKKIGNVSLVEEYGTWLAKRNPKLGVQVFADEQSKVTFEPARVVSLLKQGAPEAVKEYLEHLVFGKQVSGCPRQHQH